MASVAQVGAKVAEAKIALEDLKVRVDLIIEALEDGQVDPAELDAILAEAQSIKDSAEAFRPQS